MTEVSGVTQMPSMGLTHTGGLTADGLVLYLQSQLGDIDAKIDSFMAKQKLIQAQRKELNDLATLLDGVKVPKEGETTAMADADRDKLPELKDNLVASGYDPEFIQQLDDATFSKLGAEDLQSLKTAVESGIKDLESSASLDMIQLQSCVSQRNTCISLATNLMSAVGKGEESIAGNIGR
jgi:hypothetical protein